MIDTRLDKYNKLVKFLEENNIDLQSCSCCDGIGVYIDGLDMSEQTICGIGDMKEDLEKQNKRRSIEYEKIRKSNFHSNTR